MADKLQRSTKLVCSYPTTWTEPYRILWSVKGDRWDCLLYTHLTSYETSADLRSRPYITPFSHNTLFISAKLTLSVTFKMYGMFKKKNLLWLLSVRLQYNLYLYTPKIIHHFQKWLIVKVRSQLNPDCWRIGPSLFFVYFDTVPYLNKALFGRNMLSASFS